MNVHFLGDIHGSWGILKQVFSRYRDNRIIQVGDLGLGFLPLEYEKNYLGELVPTNADPDPEAFPDIFKFIRGNHDNPSKCREYPNYLGDFGVDKETGIFFVSGGFSIDFKLRTPGMDWWYDEELSMSQFNEAIELYEKTKPKFVLSHEPPIEVHDLLTTQSAFGPSRTSQALQAMLDIHRPDFWVFGHHHKVWRKTIQGTQFACAAINQVLTFDINMKPAIPDECEKTASLDLPVSSTEEEKAV